MNKYRKEFLDISGKEAIVNNDVCPYVEYLEEQLRETDKVLCEIKHILGDLRARLFGGN